MNSIQLGAGLHAATFCCICNRKLQRLEFGPFESSQKRLVCDVLFNQAVAATTMLWQVRADPAVATGALVGFRGFGLIWSFVIQTGLAARVSRIKLRT